MVRYSLVFPELQSVHMVKDVGYIPYFLHKNHDFDCTIATYDNSDLDKSVFLEKGIKIDTIKQYFKSSVLNGCIYIIKNARNIDILQLFHAHYKRTFFYIPLFKLINPKAKIYLKLDAPEFLCDGYDNLNAIGRFTLFLKRRILKKCFLITVENPQLKPAIEDCFKISLKCIPNGYYWDKYVEDTNAVRENRFVNVSRLSAPEKNIRLLLDSYAYYCEELSGFWKLSLIGFVDESLASYVDSFTKEHPVAADNIDFMGLRNSVDVFSTCRKSKCFVLPSKLEAFPLCLVEAISVGCYLILSDKVPSRYIMTDNGRFGTIIEVDNRKALAEAMKEMELNADVKNQYEEIKSRAKEEFEWENLVEKIYEELDK